MSGMPHAARQRCATCGGRGSFPSQDGRDPHAIHCLSCNGEGFVSGDAPATGPTTQAGQDLRRALRMDYGPMTESAIDAAIVAIEREAVDAFIRDELPGLLDTALRGDGPGSIRQNMDLGNIGRAASQVAAKVAELRK